MSWLRRGAAAENASPGARHAESPALPDDVRRALGLLPGERVLAHALDEVSGTRLVVGTARLYAASAQVSARPWHLVDGGSWDHDSFTLTVTWVDGAKPQQWVLRASTAFLAALRERVQASVVLTESVDLGAGRSARVVIRKDLADGSLCDQSILARGVRMVDPGVADLVGATRARLREQVGLD